MENSKTYYADELVETDEPITAEEIEEREMFECHAEFKTVRETNDKRTIEGYANTKNIDRYGDVIEPKAFKASLRYWLKNGVILLHHNPALPVGTPKAASVDGEGLYIKAEVAKGLSPMSYVEEAWNLVQQKVLKAFSVGFRILPGGEEWSEEQDPKSGFKKRVITKLELFETSIVSLPANRESLFDVAKGIQTGSDLEGKVPDWYRQRQQGFGLLPDDKDVREVLNARHNNEADAYGDLDEFLETMKAAIGRMNSRATAARAQATIDRMNKVLGKEA
jgi:HK97 family phage prohead protease